MKRINLPLLAAVFVMSASSGLAEETDRPRVEPNGTVHVPAFDLPESVYLSDESRAAMKYFRDVYGPEFGTFSRGCPNLFEVADDPEAARAARQCVADGYYETSIYKDTRAKHPVEITGETIAGVYTEVFVPTNGVAAANKNRVLISIHGGGFTIGARYFSHTEAMQVAHMGGYKVISPDYRMAPEFTHPAGLEDVVAVYRAMLKGYDAASIGIYGCSAGAMLTAQAVAYLLRNNLPTPGGIGLFCAGIPMTDGAVPGVFKMGRSESAFLVSAINGFPRPVERTNPPRARGYFTGVKADDPMVAPGDHDELLARFPPSLLISGTRDFALGGVLASHNRLVRLGVEANLHIWEGLGHATFAFNPRLPESDEVHNVIVRFFDEHLGR
ncbi:MAG: alpha/beta hydrolase [Gammaproteobacteria bacterium]|nr:alpha/beta hydrolase [Gammaproteobacteria bacterium]MYK45396.1 alpha/beta hydrolase [Gammaproteobacteria bacterium]